MFCRFTSLTTAVRHTGSPSVVLRSVYMSGSKNMSYDSGNLTCPDIKWLGVRPSDLEKYNIPEQCRLDMVSWGCALGGAASAVFKLSGESRRITFRAPHRLCLIQTEKDIKTGKEMLNEPFIQKNPVWVRELELMIKLKKKAEIQALSNFGFQFLTEVYLPQKLRDADWC